MPNTRAAAKRVRADQKRRLRNLARKSELRNLVRRLRSFLQPGKAAEAQGPFRLLVKRLDQAVRKGVLHRNTASRKKSRLARHLAKLEATS